MTTHPLAGALSVEASAKVVRHYRYAEERLMRVMAGWIALTPELPAKLVLGRHVWDCAQHADAWGRRLPELRAPAHRGEPPDARFARFMDLLDDCQAPGETLERLTGAYRVLKPHLAAAYGRHLAVANRVYESPTRRILERCLAEERRHVAAGEVVLARLVADDGARGRVAARQRRLTEALAEAGGITGHDEVPVAPHLEIDSSEAESDVVALGSVFDPSRVEPDLHAAVARVCHALISGGPMVAEPGVDVEAHGVRPALEAALGGGPAVWAAVACAKIGGDRIVKVRLSGSRGAAIVQFRWRRSEGRAAAPADAWQLAGVEIVRAEPAR